MDGTLAALKGMRRDLAARDKALAEAERVIDAARCIRHWHDSGDGMVVSADKVRALWDALAKYDAAAARLAGRAK